MSLLLCIHLLRQGEAACQLGRLFVMMVVGRGLLLVRGGALSRTRARYRTTETGCEQEAEQDDAADGAATDRECPDLLSHHPLQIVEAALRERKRCCVLGSFYSVVRSLRSSHRKRLTFL